MDLESKRPSGPLFRVGRDDDTWAVPDWAYAKEDGTFGNRFDDPMGVYRVFYASSQRLRCFIETLARFRVDASFVADLALMENGEDDFTAFGTVRRAWIKGRCIGTAKIEWELCGSLCPRMGQSFQVGLGRNCGETWNEGLRPEFSGTGGAPRIDTTGRPDRVRTRIGYAGAFYHSHYGHSIGNWAIFEDWTMSKRFSIRQPNS